MPLFFYKPFKESSARAILQVVFSKHINNALLADGSLQIGPMYIRNRFSALASGLMMMMMLMGRKRSETARQTLAAFLGSWAKPGLA